MEPTQILALIGDQETERAALFDRMDRDFERFILKPFAWPKDLAAFKKYTSNQPRVFANKAISLLSTAKLRIRVHQDEAEEQQRKINNDMERFAIGGLRANDHRLRRRRGQPILQGQLAWYSCMRGFVTGRGVLVKDAMGQTSFDSTPFDPRFTFHDFGYDGLAWLCHVTLRTRTEIESAYGITVDGAESTARNVPVYDFYDTMFNFVFLKDGRYLKPPTIHGCDCVPCYYIPVGDTPLVQDTSGEEVAISAFGESIYNAARDVYNEHNFNMSAFKELTARSLKQGIKTIGPPGGGTIKMEQDPYVTGTEIDLPFGADVKPLGLLEMAKEMPLYMTAVGMERQTATFSEQAYGTLPFQLSNMAVETLNRAMGSVIEGPRAAMTAAYEEIIDLWRRAYVRGGGAYGTVSVSGASSMQRQFSNVAIPPEVVAQAGEVTVKLLPDLPQDQPAKWQAAGMATGGPSPLASKRFAREELLELQDSDLVEDEVNTEQAEMLSPTLKMYTLMMALADRGEVVKAEILLGEILRMLAVQQAEAIPGVLGAAQQRGLNVPQLAQPGMSGVPANVAPAEATGTPKPQGPPQAGPLVPAGSPRPGAQENPSVMAGG